MNWKNEILLIEQKQDWKNAIYWYENNEDKELEIYLRIIFVLLDFLVDGNYTAEEHDLVSFKIKKMYDETHSKFLNNSEFLFFAGIMIFIAEWYFGMDDVETGTIMLKKAMQNNPDNILYKWAFYTITDQRASINTDLKQQLSIQILKKIEIIEWLKNKGLIGKYVLGILKPINVLN